MAKKVLKIIKTQAKGGQANPAPPLGPVLGQAGINIQEFCTKFNDKTKTRMGQLIPVEITLFEDRSFTFILKQPPASFLILQKLNKEKGSGTPNKDKIGSIKWTDIVEIAKQKMPDMNTTNVESAARTVAGTAKNMGLLIDGMPDMVLSKRRRQAKVAKKK